ncbi:unnamed protein product [Periconia digitata]|uniref:Nudix hydrolase domain-containing protein n=1 Tax=Periconia digitata TaxID=1303443 RepID=A0A9W4U4C7_9PLEO|nr:unnamed protein product [Periconia digitata]
MSLTNLDLVNECDGFPYYETNPDVYLARVESYYELCISGYDYALGFMLPAVAEVFRGVPHWELDDEEQTLTLTEGNDAASRTAAIDKTLLAVRSTGHFKVLDKWRNEMYPVYGLNKELLFSVERSASPLFGVVTYGVHLTAYVKKNGETWVWIPRRAKTKQTYGGMLDNAVAGGMATGETAYESMVRECGEEASLSEELVRKLVKPVGCITYFSVRGEKAGGETGLLQPEVEYVYDLELPEDVILKPNDDEVEEFYLMSVDQVKTAMAQGEFKPNCALVMIDFFIRHGYLTAENEKDYIEIVQRLHRRFEFPTL